MPGIMPGVAKSRLRAGHNLPVAMRAIRIDLTPLRRSPAFRTFFAGGLITSLGSMVTYVAIPFQIAELTGSFVAVGLIGLAELVPLVVFGLYGGSLADRVDRRIMVIAGELASGIVAVVLMINALMPEPQIIVIYIAAMAFATVDGLQRPSLDAMLPRVVDHADLSAAGALNSLRMSSAAIAGPAVAGLLLAAWGPAAAYTLDAVSFAVAVIVFTRLPRVRALQQDDVASGLGHIWSGMRYAWSRKDIMGTYAIDLAAMTFAFPFALFPFIAEQFAAPWSLGLLYSAGFIGSAVFGLTSGWAVRVRHHGRAIALAAVLWGLAIGLMALAPGIAVIVILLAVAGYFDMMSGHFRSLMWNQSIPDDVRGRMAGIEVLSYSIGPMLGQVRSTTAAQLFGLRASFATGGILCIAAVGAACWMFPAVWRYDADTDEHVRRRHDDG